MLVDTIKDNTVLCSSYLLKRNKYTTKWQKRWITLRCGQLSYYVDPREVKPIKVINKYNLKSFHVLNNNQLLIYTNSRCLQFKTDDKKVLQEWVDALNQFFHNIDQELELEYAFNYNAIKEQERDDDDPDEALALSELISTQIPTQTAMSGTVATDVLEAAQIDPGVVAQTHPDATSAVPQLEPPETPVLVEQGTLHKLFRRSNKWKPFFIMLTTKHFILCANETSKPYKVVETRDMIDVIEVDPIKNKKWCLLVITKSKTMRFCARDEQEFVKWLSALKTVCILNRDKGARIVC